MSRISTLRNALHKRYKDEECEACKKLRKGLTWVGDPPKCRKHRKKVRSEYYY